MFEAATCTELQKWLSENSEYDRWDLIEWKPDSEWERMSYFRFKVQLIHDVLDAQSRHALSEV